jgi:hypothetical protein
MQNGASFSSSLQHDSDKAFGFHSRPLQKTKRPVRNWQGPNDDEEENTTTLIDEISLSSTQAKVKFLDKESLAVPLRISYNSE